MGFCNVVNKFHDKHCFSNTSTTKQANLSTSLIWCKEIDNLRIMNMSLICRPTEIECHISDSLLHSFKNTHSRKMTNTVTETQGNWTRKIEITENVPLFQWQESAVQLLVQQRQELHDELANSGRFLLQYFDRKWEIVSKWVYAKNHKLKHHYSWLTNIASLINRLSNNIHDTAKSWSTNRHLTSWQGDTKIIIVNKQLKQAKLRPTYPDMLAWITKKNANLEFLETTKTPTNTSILAHKCS